MEVETLLREFVFKNRDTEIGKRWKFGEISSLPEYKHQVPLTSYDVYKPYIDRMADHGEQNLLTINKVLQFAPSSGTTGKMKLIPVVTTVDVTKLAPSATQRIHLFISTFDLSRNIATPSGIRIQTISSIYYYSMCKTYPESYTLPIEAYKINKNPTVYTADIFYVQLIFSLKDTSATIFQGPFIHVFLSAFKQLIQKWPQMINDIEKGEFDESLSISADEKKCLDACLGGPDPVRADQLREIFQQATKNNFREIIPEVWPNVKLIICSCSGNLASYVPTLQHYAGPGIHVQSFIYGCSEGGIIGVPARPLTETSLFKLTSFNYYEFIPFSESTKDQPNTLLASEVKAGEIYEIVMTTQSGFYRYRIGDYIKVIEQTKDGPLIDFYARKKMALQLAGQLLYEFVIEAVMTDYSKTIQSRIDYIVAINEATYNGFQIWIECDTPLSNVDEIVDKSLQEVDEDYLNNRSCNKLDILVVKQVKAGTFDEVFTYMKSRTVNVEDQLKMPRMIFKDEISQTIKKILVVNED